MSSGPNIYIANGVSNRPNSLFKYINKNQSLDNMIKIQKEIETDFFTGPNGKTLPKELKNWIGKNRKTSLLKKVKNPKLKNAINQLYRDTSFIGDGGTASIIKFENRTGLGLGRNGNTHLQKGKELLSYLEKKVIPQNSLTAKERKIANNLAKALKKAIYGG